MILKSPKTRTFVTNLLAEFILSKISKEFSTIIQVADCQNFYVIKGKTSSPNVLNTSEILDEMHSKYSELLPEKRVTNTIDLIEYDSKITDIENFEFSYFNTDNNCYHYKEIEEYGLEKQENMIVTSEFPHGFSLSQGRSLFYYFKTVTYSIPTTYPFTSLTYFFSKNTEQKLKIMNNFYGSEDSILESAVLDYFDFDTTKLDEEMKKVDWLTELTNPLEENQIILNNKKSMIIV